MAKKKTQVKGQAKYRKDEWFLLLPILVMVTVFLFAVRARVIPSNMTDYFWYSSSEYVGDLYAYFRMEIMLVVTSVFTLYLIYTVAVGGLQIRKHKIYIPMAIYAAFVLISYFCSENKDLALFGAPDRYEGTVSLICYMVLLFYSIQAVRSEQSVKLVVKCFAVACFILSIWGIMQTMGIRLSDVPEVLIVPEQYRGGISLSEKMEITSSNWFFSNPNYSSFFMVFPISLFAMAFIGEEDKKKKWVYAILTGLALFCLWRSESLGGMIALAVAVIVAFIIAGLKNVKKWGKKLGILILVAVLSICTSLPTIMAQIQSGAQSGNSIVEINADEENNLRFAEIDYIITDGFNIIFSFEGEEITIATQDGKILSITDSNGADVADENGLLLATAFVHEESGYDIVAVKTANKTWNFVSVEQGIYYMTRNNKAILLDKVESIGFENNLGFASGRGYIWSRTLPLLKDTLLYGKGADTYAIHFPQSDYSGKYNAGFFNDERDVVVDKPHNMYLGAAVNTGVISMIALIAIYAIYLIESIKVYRKREFKSFMEYIGMGICIAISGFVVAGLVNDSTVQMMPTVYAFLGMGLAINRMLKEEE